jgi:hypothetical protein
VSRRLETSGEWVCYAEALDACWPGDDPTSKQAINRLHVAISTLRRMGLRTAILSNDQGYMLDPDVELVEAPG